MLHTGVWTAQQGGAHGDVSVPGERMKAHVASCERRVQIVDSLDSRVHVTSELLHTTTTRQTPPPANFYTPQPDVRLRP